MTIKDPPFLKQWINEIEMDANGCMRDTTECDKVYIYTHDIQCKIKWIKEVLKDMELV